MKTNWIIIFLVIIVSLVIAAIYPKYMGWKMPQNDQLAERRFQILSDAIEKYIIDNKGVYPNSLHDLATYLDTDEKIPFCKEVSSGYIYTCDFGFNSYRVTARPILKNKTGSRIFTSAKDRLVYQAMPETDSQTALPTDTGRSGSQTKGDSLAVRGVNRISQGDPSKLRLLSSSTEKDGMERKYYENGQLIYEVPVVNSKKHGIQTSFYDDGSLLGEVEYVDGLKEGTEKQYYRDGQERSETEFLNDKKHGKELAYYSDGTLNSETEYREGKKDGTEKIYDIKGALIRSTEYRDGEAEQ